MREMLKGVWVVAILVLAFSGSYYYFFNDVDSRLSSELSPVSSMPAPDARTLFAAADAQDLEPSDSGSTAITEPVPSSNQLIESIESNGDAVGAFGAGVTVFAAPDMAAPDMTPIHGAGADPAVSLFSASGAGQVEVAAASGDAGMLGIRTTVPQSGSGGPQRVVYEAERPFSASTECKFCHPRQYQEWRTSPHSYSGISPTFYSLVAAGQNSFGVGALINISQGVSIAGAAGNFCLPCHSPMGFIGLEGRFSGNNLGFSEVQPQFPFVCNLDSPPGVALVTECTFENSAEICGARGRCTQFEARTCINMPPVSEGADFPRVRKHCFEDDDCSGSGSGCPEGEDCGPCIISPTTIYYSPEAQEGINCESCHNILPNHRRACQQFRNSDSVGVFAVDLQERDLDGTRLRLGPYPVDQISNGQGIPGDQVSPRRNAFHESARVDTPLAVNYEDTDWANGIRNPLNTDPEVVRPTSVTCDELPYCLAGLCEGGPNIGATCGSGPDADFNCGGCSAAGTCGLGSDRVGQACRTSVDCANVTGPAEGENLMTRAIADGTLGPLFAPDIGGGVRQLDRPDANYYRSSMFCGTCHDVRPPFGNPVLRSCELQDTHVCSTDADCQDLNIGCPGDDCGPCLMENGSSPDIATSPGGVTPDVGSPRNTGVRRVENLFTEWQISPYNHPELTFCDGNAFRACNNNTDCSDFGDGLCTVRSPNPTEVVTCQDCHMSLFPRVPLVADTDGDGTPDTVTDRNDLYAQDLAAIEGSQSDLSKPLPIRRVSTHYMPGVDLPLIPFSGQGTQEALRQEILDSTYKLDFDDTPTTATAGATFDVELTIENVGVGHRHPSGFSHERQNWVPCPENGISGRSTPGM
ncbi:MAG: hypothetical protein JRG89_16375 [Deltaproteobacteria bacterium]|nr:hypothetical protein [Deltaproteobacteria bacterium]